MNELLLGYAYILLYIVVVVPILLLLRLKTKVPDEVFRKLLHCVLLGLATMYLSVYDRWWIAVLACVILVVVAYPVLSLFERFRTYSNILTERKSGEIKASLLLVFSMLILVISVCIGIFDDKLLAYASIYAWGFGDAVAALVGKRFGKHKVNFKAVGGKKSWEGTLAMLLTSFLSVMVVLVLRGGLSLPAYLVISLVAAFVSAAIELFTKGGNDTITCPLGAMATLIVLLYAFGGL